MNSSPNSEILSKKIVNYPSEQKSSEPPSSHQENQPASWSTAIQSVLDQPPSNLPQYFLIGGMAFSLLFGTWAWFGQIEDVGKAQGKLVPRGETYKLEPIELGKVSRIAVKEGENVQAGQILVELDTELAGKEVERLQQTLFANKLELGQKQVLLERVSSEAQARATITAAVAQTQQAAIASAWQKAATIRQLLGQKQTEKSASGTRQVRLNKLTKRAQQRLNQLYAEEAIHKQRISRLATLKTDGAISQEYIFQAEQALRQIQQQITQSQLQEVSNANEQIYQGAQASRELEARTTQSQGELQSTLTEAKRLQAEFSQKQAERASIELEAEQKLQQLRIEITQIQAKIAETKNLLVSAQSKLKYKFLKAPVDGVVLSLNLKQTGEVIEAGKLVAEIAPNGVPLVLSAVLPNKEVGFVKIGMPVQIKLDAFPYQDYGVLPGKVTQISPDAKSDKDLGEIYQVEIALERNYVTANQQRIQLKAGQTATADIIIRQRRIIEVLLDPIRKVQKDGIKL